ncbi:unnamed protein product, partial [Mesorhabditis spiculigera]
MSFIWKRIQRSNKTGTKFTFRVNLQELIVVGTQDWHPEFLSISLMHRRRIVVSKQRQWEPSYSKDEQCVLVWPDQAPEILEFTATLYKRPNDQHWDNKNWTIALDAIDKKGKRKCLGADTLNINLFAYPSYCRQGHMRLKFRPLVPQLQCATLMLVISSQKVEEGQEASSGASAAVEPKVPAAGEGEDLKAEIVTATVVTESVDGHGGEKDTGHVSMELSSSTTDSRPTWRAPAQSTPVDAIDPHAVSTEMFFKVDGGCRPVHVPSPVKATNQPSARQSFERSSTRASSRAPSLPPPAKEGLETVLQWAQRITRHYPGVNLSDFTKSWRSGQALCAIIHAHRSDLLPYEELSFNDTLLNYKENIQHALVAANVLGVSDIPDESYFLTPDSVTIRHFVEKLRHIFEGGSDEPQPAAGSDYRLSQMFPISDSEKKVLDELKLMQEIIMRKDSFPDMDQKTYFSDYPSTSNANDAYNHTGGLQNGHHGESGSSLASSSVRARAASPSRKEELRMKARQMLNNPSSALGTHPRDANPELHERAKAIISNAIQSTGNLMVRKNGALRHGSSSRSLTSEGSSADLRVVGTVPMGLTFRSFRQQDPSPVLHRKDYGSPHVSAMSLSSAQAMVISTSDLGESSPPLQNSAEMSTPTRAKLKSKWELDVADPVRTAKEMAAINEEMRILDAQADQVRQKMQEPEMGDEEECQLMETLQFCHIEKDRLVGRQEYYNNIENIRLAEAECSELQQLINDDSMMNGEMASDLVQRLLLAMDRRKELTMKVVDAEEQIEERAEMLRGDATRNSSTLIRHQTPGSASSQRGTPQYKSMRERASQWFTSKD